MPANATPLLRSGRVAAANIPAYAPVKADGTPAANGEEALGIAEASCLAGQRVSLVVDGSAEAWAGAAIADGQALQVGPNNTVVPLAGGVLIGRALNAAAAGDKVEVLLSSSYAAGGSQYLGTFTDLATLQSLYPAASNAGNTAMAGGLPYVSNGVAWAALKPAYFSGLRAECGLFGDSIMERETTGPTGASYMGRSITAWTGFCAPTTTGPLLQPRYNDGVGGDTLDQIIARLPTAVGRDVDITVYRGGTNSTTLSFADWAAKQQTIIGTLAANKKLVIVKGIPPQNVTGTSYGARRQVIPMYNKITEGICAQYANVIYIDEFRNLVESGWPNTGEGAPIGAGTVGTAASGAVALVMAGNHDTLHPGDYGGVLAGLKAANELAGRLSTIPGETYGPNLITLTGTTGTNTPGGGTITGDTPFTGWTLNNAVGNAAIQVTRLANGYRLQVTAAAQSAFLLTGPNILGSLSAGKIVRHGAKLSFSNVSGVNYVRQFLRSSGSDVSRAVDWESYVPPIGIAAWVRSVRYQIPSGLTDLIYGLSCSLNAGGSINIDFVDPELFTVSP